MSYSYGVPPTTTSTTTKIARTLQQSLPGPANDALQHVTQSARLAASQIAKQQRGGRSWTRIISIPNVVIALWALLLWYGERTAIRGSIDACDWSSWEDWPSDATPHHLVFVADPQLVDPHTYPGRPWPLSSLTFYYTDQYLRRSFTRIQTSLYPDTVFFLGDLFDGGREWSTPIRKGHKEWKTLTGNEDKARFNQYGQSFWLKEYQRFGNIFFNHWTDAGTKPRPYQEGRKVIASLPGNHDLGFALGVQPAIRRRFNAYFGDGNRIDIIANHTFISLDTVSLSAFGQPASQENIASVNAEEVWWPTMDFLHGVQTLKKRSISRFLRTQNGLAPEPAYKHTIIDTPDLPGASLPQIDNEPIEDLPTILLTHVPLYREPGTPCGPHREHWPPSVPSKDGSSPTKDDRNAIAVARGYQYQNVLSPEVAKEITEEIGTISYAFSGDDHDYCEVVHRGYPSAGGGIKEITVKALSWAMGVRKPGFVMASMWNPVNDRGKPLTAAGKPTMQTHLCLLPDQIGIFIRYAAFFGVTLATLFIRAILIAFFGFPSSSASAAGDGKDEPLLPTTRQTIDKEKAHAEDGHRPTHKADASDSSSSSTSDNRRNLSARNTTRTRSVSPAGGYGLPPSQASQPLIEQAGYFEPARGAEVKEKYEDLDAWGMPRRKPVKGFRLFWTEVKGSIGKVAAVVFLWYFWLLWRW